MININWEEECSKKWSEQIKSIIFCDNIYIKSYKGRIIEVSLESKHFKRDFIFDKDIFCLNTLHGDGFVLEKEIQIMKSKINLKKKHCYLAKISENEEILFVGNDSGWVDLVPKTS